jgi:hypothetical protein
MIENMKETCETGSNHESFKDLLQSARFWKPVSAAVIGGTLGFLYYYFVGCSSGTCAITGNPYTSILFGAVFGLFLVNRPCSKC